MAVEPKPLSSPDPVVTLVWMGMVARGNLDGLPCAVLIDKAEPIDRIELIHPHDITDDKFQVEPTDILANLPYHPNCAKWFDHHSHTRTYERPPSKVEGRCGLAPSTARLVYDHYLWDNPGFNAYEDLVRETDRYDGAGLTMADVLDPKDYILLGFTLDRRCRQETVSWSIPTIPKRTFGSGSPGGRTKSSSSPPSVTASSTAPAGCTSAACSPSTAVGAIEARGRRPSESRTRTRSSKS